MVKLWQGLDTCTFTLLTRSMGCYDIKVGSCISPTCDALMAHLFCLWRGSKLFCQPFVLWPGMNLSQLLGGRVANDCLPGALGSLKCLNHVGPSYPIHKSSSSSSSSSASSASSSSSSSASSSSFYIQYPYLWKILTAPIGVSGDCSRLCKGAQYSLASLILRVSFHDCVPICENPWQNLPNVGAESLNKDIWYI